MPQIKIECTYCGEEDTVYVYDINDTSLRCEKCKDRHLIRRPINKDDNNPFGYGKE